jgi:glycogen debranching enzyme GlgX
VFFSVFDESGEEELYRFGLPHRLGDVHYGFVAGIASGTRYGLRVAGPWDEALGHRFDVEKLLVDPYATAIDRPYHHEPELTLRGVDTAALVPKSIVVEPAERVPLLPARWPRFIYELQVRAFSKLHPGVATSRQGTVAALAEPVVIDHLVKLGVDTVELMPLAAWIDERHLPPLGLANAWGYNPVSFMAPDPRLAPGGLAEIRQAVSALHGAGIRVLLDVVLNHTGESDTGGATLSLRGLDNALYYRHSEGRLVNDTGCGNTLALDRAPVMQLAMDAMRSWVLRTGIDGFRFDLATVMGRAGEEFSTDAPLLAAIEQDPLLSGLTMIAEPWDVGPGGYQLGQFPPRWGEWNDHFRDDVRHFWRGDAGSAARIATRLAGSSDIFAPHRSPTRSINFVAAHDGFTLADVVTYATKHNEANGEGNRDGNGNEVTWSDGNVRALLASLLLARGTPMLTAGDEFGRTQRGNNNAYAQDNATTWLDWQKADTGLVDFVRGLTKLRRSLPLLTVDKFLTGVAGTDGLPDAQWFGADGEAMAWDDQASRILGLVLADDGQRIMIWLNGGADDFRPVLRARDGRRWVRAFCSAEGADVPSRAIALYTEEKTGASGIADDTLYRLADAAGVYRDWWEVDGTHHQVSPESLRAVLRGLRIPHDTVADADRSLAELAGRLSPLVVMAGAEVPLGSAGDRRRRFLLKAEDGSVATIDVGPGLVPTADLVSGYYDVWTEDDPARRRKLIASPGQCYLPDEIANGRRVFGLAAHLYELRHEGGHGIGDLETLLRYARLTTDVGGRLAGINPLHHLFPTDRSRVSPYQPSDRRFVDPIYISIELLLRDYPLSQAASLAGKGRAAFAKLEALPAVDYPAVWAAKREILEQAFAEFPGDASLTAFMAAGGEDLARHCAFERAQESLQSDPRRLAFHGFLQWLADSQLHRAAAHRNIYRDLALGCAFDGGEASAAPDLFGDGISLGAPPDPFSRQGQVWNLPPFSPLALMDTDFAAFRAVLSANMRHAAALRIDHVLGLARQFWIPRGAEGRSGAYVSFPLNALLAVTAIESQRTKCMIIGEDLGTIPDGLREALHAADILSYKVLWFERDGLGFRPPAGYPALALACLTSHDLPTFLGWRASRDIEIERELKLIDDNEKKVRLARRQQEITLLDAISHPADASPEAASVAVHGFVASTASAVMLAQAADLAGETEPLNVPGTDTERPNWRRRIACNIETLGERPLANTILSRVRKERPA